MSDHPETDALEEADFHKYSDDDAVPIGCYHRMTAHARDMEASAKAATRMLGDSWEDLKEARAFAQECHAWLDREGYAVNPLPWESSAND